MMRILHTSDWHLGAATGPASRLPEQRRFLDWLLGVLEREAIDALLVAGDIFDAMQPPSEAQLLYFDFLARVAGSGVRDVIVVGGNHDAASRLNAPRSVLAAQHVHVVGGLPAGEQRLDSMIVPLRARGSDDLVAVCLAVPFVHEYRLGIRTTRLDTDQTLAEFKAAFSSLYQQLADRAIERFGALPLIATGHLTMGDQATAADFPRPIHQVGTIDALPSSILDPRLRYTALGHIHRSYPVVRAKVWYSGTPIPYSLHEMAARRQVLRVDISANEPTQVTPIEVPITRELVQLVGSADQVKAALGALSWSAPLPPLVHALVHTTTAEPGLVTQLHEVLAHFPAEARPLLVEVQQRAPLGERGADELPRPSLDTLNPAQVFGLMCDAAGHASADRSQLEAAFATVAATSGEDLEAFLEQIEPTTPTAGATP